MRVHVENIRNPRDEAPTHVQFDEDSISLIDIWLLLARRKWILAIFVILAVIVALIYVTLVPPLFSYTTTIEIGSQILNDQVTPIESQETVRTKIAESYIPLALQDFAKDDPEGQGRFAIKANTPRNSQIVLLHSTGPENQEDNYRHLHNMVVKKIQEDHRRVSNVLRKNIESSIEARKRRITDHKENAGVIAARIKRLDDERELLVAEVDQTEVLIETANRNRIEAIKNVAEESRAMTLLLITEELRHNRARLTNLRKRIAVDIPEQHDKLAKELADNQRAQENELAQIESLRLALSGLLETRSVSPSIKSGGAVGPANLVILVLAVCVGLMIGIIAVMFTEFSSIAKTREHQKRMGESLKAAA